MVSIKTVGIILVLALLVTPAATGALMARRVPGIMAYGIASALLSTFFGLYLSFHVDLPSGPSIVVVATGLFFTCAIVFSSQGCDVAPPRLYAPLRGPSLRLGPLGTQPRTLVRETLVRETLVRWTLVRWTLLLLASPDRPKMKMLAALWCRPQRFVKLLGFHQVRCQLGHVGKIGTPKKYGGRKMYDLTGKVAVVTGAGGRARDWARYCPSLGSRGG